MRDWFLNNQVRIIAVASLACVLATIVTGGGWWLILLFSLASTAVVAVGWLLFTNESEWLDWSWSQMLLNILGGALMLIGWVVFLRGVVVLTIAKVLLASG